MSMDTPQSLESSSSQSDPLQIRDPDMLVITHNDIGHFTAAGHQQAHLSLYLK